MENLPLVTINESLCRMCYACVRVCPVKAIRMTEGDKTPRILPERCIGCGLCVEACSPGAISVRDSRQEVRSILASGDQVVAITDPSISGEFDDITDYRKFVQMIKALGFQYVNEASFGVDLVARQYADMIIRTRGKNFITSCCPVVVSYIEKYHPDLIPNLIPVVSPMIASARVVRKKYGSDVKVVYIGPCIEAKNEISRFEGDARIDAVLTFKELRQLFEEAGINESMLEYSDFNSPLGYKGSLYPISNGILQAASVSEDLLTGTVITA
jgi:iron only hydrogenase large subunit-like protein